MNWESVKQTMAEMDRLGLRYSVKVEVHPEPSQKDLMQLAHHEAGHAAAAALLRGLRGVTGLELSDFGSGALCGEDSLKDPVESLAGPWAEARYAGKRFDFVSLWIEDEDRFALDWEHTLDGKPEDMTLAAWFHRHEQRTARLMGAAGMWEQVCDCATCLMAAPLDKKGRRFLPVESLRRIFAPAARARKRRRKARHEHGPGPAHDHD